LKGSLVIMNQSEGYTMLHFMWSHNMIFWKSCRI
jgi:hypothetical protein